MKLGNFTTLLEMELEYNVDSNSEIQNINKSDKRTQTEDVPKRTVEISDLVQLVTCSIHLEKLVDPRQLSCQHAFCYKCLKKCYDQDKRDCPLCCKEDAISDVNELPKALVQNDLLDILEKNAIKDFCSPSVDLSNKETENIDRYLLKKKNRDSVIDGDIIGDAPIIEEYMSVNVKYEYVQEYSRNILQNIYQNKTSNMEFEFSIFDISMIDGQPKSMQLVLIDCKSNEINLIFDSNLRKFYIKIEEQIIKPEYIRIFKSTLILSGKLTKNNHSYSVFLQCNMNGEILHQSEHIRWLDNSSSISMMAGFDIDKKEGLYYLSKPQSKKVAIYDSSMIELYSYYLIDNQPEYVAICLTENQLWISCPQNRRILILDMNSKRFKTLNTDPAIPKMIFCTNDEKIIYFDKTKNRLIWIIYLENKIYAHPLLLSHIKKEFVIKSIQILPTSQIILNNGSEILMFQSINSISKWSGIWKLCSIL